MKKPFSFGPQLVMAPPMPLPLPRVQGDYPTRVQVLEGGYAGGGAQSRFVGMGTAREAYENDQFKEWPQINATPFER